MRSFCVCLHGNRKRERRESERSERERQTLMASKRNHSAWLLAAETSRDKVFPLSFLFNLILFLSFFLFPGGNREEPELKRERSREGESERARERGRENERGNESAGRRQGFSFFSTLTFQKKINNRSALCSSPPSRESTSSSWALPGLPSPSSPAGWPSWSAGPTLRGC